MSQLILGIVVDVLVHVAVKNLKGGGVEWTPTPSRNFAILDSSQLVVLLPQIGFENFCSSQKPENGGISWRETARFFFCSMADSRKPGCKEPGACDCCSCCQDSFLQKQTAIRFLIGPTSTFFHVHSPSMTFAYLVVMTQILTLYFPGKRNSRSPGGPRGFRVWQIVPGSFGAGAMMAPPVLRQLRIRSWSLANLSRPLMIDDPDNNFREAHPSLIHAPLSACAPSSR